MLAKEQSKCSFSKERVEIVVELCIFAHHHLVDCPVRIDNQLGRIALNGILLRNGVGLLTLHMNTWKLMLLH